MADKLKISEFDDKRRFIKVGKLTNQMINFLKNKSENPIVDVLTESDIVLWDNRIEYTGKHKFNFQTIEEYYECLESIPKIIENPDYIGLPPHDDSIQFIKVFNSATIVAVRVSQSGKLSYRTMYPITDSQLRDYEKKNRAWKI